MMGHAGVLLWYSALGGGTNVCVFLHHLASMSGSIWECWVRVIVLRAMFSDMVPLRGDSRGDSNGIDLCTFTPWPSDDLAS